VSSIPVAETDQLVAQANALMNKRTSPSPFELAQLDRDINRFGKADVVLYQCFRGVYYALKDDLANTTKWFDMALGANPTNHYIYRNYASSLCRLGQHEKAVIIALEGINKGDYTQESIDNLLLRAYYANNHAVLDEWLPKYEKLTDRPHDVAFWLKEDAEDELELPAIHEEAQKHGYTPWEQVKKELGL